MQSSSSFAARKHLASTFPFVDLLDIPLRESDIIGCLHHKCGYRYIFSWKVSSLLRGPFSPQNIFQHVETKSTQETERPGDSKWPFHPLFGGLNHLKDYVFTIPKRSPAELPVTGCFWNTFRLFFRWNSGARSAPCLQLSIVCWWC